MTHDLEFDSKGIEITVTSKSTGKRATITLDFAGKRWKVVAKGFSGYYSSLDQAVNEVAAMIETFGREE